MNGSNETFNPFPGLRPFRYEESHLYFGREEQIGEVLDKLIEHHFVAIIGTSGIGKSSFINCGILPILFKDYKTARGSKWEAVNFRPGNSALKNMAKALLHEKIEYADEDTAQQQIENTVSSFRKNENALINIAGNRYKASGRNILIYIDQFEEIFRYREKNDSNYDDVSIFLNLLIAAISQNEVPVYVAITMRSDFVGDCAKYPEFTDKINDSQFLIPQMTRLEKKKAIIGPIETVGATIDEDLVQKILNDVGDDADSLPVMQHALMRTYDYWLQNSFKGDEISFAHYEAIGGMEKALSIHANEAFYELNEKQQALCEKIFKNITEKGDGGRGTRRPTRLQEIAVITGATTEEVMFIVEHFRAAGRTLLMPPYNVPLTEDSMVDISHESLMRIWTNLREWVDDESESAKLYLRLCEAAEMHQLGKAGLWRPPDLQLALSWLDTHKPSLSWGLRYNPGYERAMLFLEYSKNEYEKEQRNKQKIQKRRLFIAKVTTGVFGLAFLIAFGFFLYGEKQRIIAGEEKIKADSARIKAIEKGEQARLAAIKADSSRRVALQQKEIATSAMQEARRNERIARDAVILADSAKNDALNQKHIADIAKEDAYNLRLLSIARSMAIKSLQIADPEEMGLVAQQAYKFNSENGGNPLDPDIYSGLYYAVKKLQGSGYNQLIKHTDNVRVLTSVPGSRNQIYSTGSDGTILLWNLNDRANPTTVKSHTDRQINKSMALSPDKKWLVTGGDYGYLQLYSVTNPGDPKLFLIGQNEKIRSTWYLEFASNNQFISVGEDKRILLWNIPNEITKTTVITPQEITQSDLKINSIALNPKKRVIATAKIKGQITFINMDTKEEHIFFEDIRTRSDMVSVAFSNDGKMLAAGNENGTVRVWDLRNNMPLTISDKHSARVNNIRFSADNSKLATGSFDATVRIWNTERLNDPPIILDDHDDWVWSIEFSPNGDYLLAGCKDHRIRMWPTKIESMANIICGKISRNMELKEWEDFVADTTDIPYERTCRNYNGL
ncbi:hypothetical protein GCM10009122_53550 [Fulvivirga kasyanovii]